MKPVLVIQSHADVPPSTLIDYFEQRKRAYLVLKTYEEWSEPDLTEGATTILLGTPHSANQYSQYEPLRRVHSVITRAFKAEQPCLGICGSSQLMALVTGAEVRRNKIMEAGVCQVTVNESGLTDPLLTGCGPDLEVFQWHGDTFDLPDSASLLASSADCRNQIFRSGRMVGIQFHPEVDRQIVRLWCEKFGKDLERTNQAASDVILRFDSVADKLKRLNFQLLDNYLEEI